MNSENINEKHEKDMERIRALRIIDDQFMSKVFEDKECAEVLLRAILKKKDLKGELTRRLLALKRGLPA